MIDFSLDEDIELAVSTARRFASEVLAPMQRDFERDRAVPAAVWQQACEIGFATLEWPEAMGGAGLGALAKTAVLEALAEGDPAAALALDPLGPAGHALRELGGAAALEQYGAPLATQVGARAVLVFDDARAVRITDGRATGSIAWVPADRVDLLVVLSRSGMVLVRQGIELVRLPGAGLRAAGASQLTLTEAPAIVFEDTAAAARALGRARLDVAALMVGQMHAAAEYARLYALDRVAFGKPIAHHQALAFLIVDMRAAVDAARALLREAAWRADSGRPFAAEAACAFVEAAEAAMFVGPNAVQILGGSGFMRDYPVEKHMRELRALGLLLGGVDAAKDDAVGEPDVGSGIAPLDGVGPFITAELA